MGLFFSQLYDCGQCMSLPGSSTPSSNSPEHNDKHVTTFCPSWPQPLVTRAIHDLPILPVTLTLLHLLHLNTRCDVICFLAFHSHGPDCRRPGFAYDGFDLLHVQHVDGGRRICTGGNSCTHFGLARPNLRARRARRQGPSASG